MTLKGSRMFKQKSGVLHAFLFASASLILTLVLTACNLIGGSGASSTPTPTPTPKPSPTATTPPLTTYTGNGFTISYPQGWKVTQQDSNTAIQFSDPLSIYNLAVATTPNPEGVASPDTVINTTLSAGGSRLKNTHMVNVPPTTRVGGDTWSQKAETGDTTVNGQNTTVKLVVIADNHPANSLSTNSYVIAYGTGQSLFDAATTTYFQPMLQSFKFT
jgi:hypothetical protein